MRILLTGTSSFVGRNIAVRLADRGFEVVGTYRTRFAAMERLAAYPNLRLTELDVAEAKDFARLSGGFDAVIHNAGVSTATAGLDEMLACNVAGAANVAAFASRAAVRRLVYVSTLSVHGDIEEETVDETTPVRRPGPYGASKYLGERIFSDRLAGIPCACVRLPGVLGRGAHRAWLPTVLDKLTRNERVTIYHPRGPFNNAAHVDDLSDLFANLLSGDWTGFHSFPVGAAGMMTVQAAVETLRQLTASTSEIAVAEARRPSFVISSDYARRHFGYAPMTIESMLARYAAESRVIP